MLANLEARAEGRRYAVLLPSTMEAGAWILAGGTHVAGLSGYTGIESMPSGPVAESWIANHHVGFALVNRRSPHRGLAAYFKFWCHDESASLPPHSVVAHHYLLYHCT